MKTLPNFKNPIVRQQVAKYPAPARKKLRELRSLIIEVARDTPGVGELEECLKWNEPSFLTSESKSGSTIRIDWKARDPNRVHIYFKCTTCLVRIFRKMFPNDFDYEGNRQISFGLGTKIPRRKLKKCIKITLTYHSKNYKDYFA